MIKLTCRDEAFFPASFDCRHLGRVERKYGQVIVLPSGLVTVFPNGVITKAAKIGLRVFEPLEEVFLVERMGLIPVLGSDCESQKIASFGGVEPLHYYASRPFPAFIDAAMHTLAAGHIHTYIVHPDAFFAVHGRILGV